MLEKARTLDGTREYAATDNASSSPLKSRSQVRDHLSLID